MLTSKSTNCWDKYLTKPLKEGCILAHSSKIQFILVGKSWEQELEVAGHIVFTVRKQREADAGA